MKSKDMNEILEMFTKMLELKDEMQKKYNACREEDDNEDKEDDESEESKLVHELGEDYEKIMIWCFGKKYKDMTALSSLIKWKEMHPDLPVPRSIRTDKLTPELHTIGLMIDVIPMYHEWKNNED